MAESVTLVGVKETLAVLRSVEPESYKQLNKDIESALGPAKSAIKRSIPSVAPLSGMMGNGRTSWSQVSVKTSKSLVAKSGSKLVQVVAKSTNGAGFEIADIAGRGSGRGRNPKSVTREYGYKGGTRRHHIDGQGKKNPNRVYRYATQGQALITNLSGKPSRYVYPSVEQLLPQIQTEVFKSLETAAAVINRKLNVL
jgi:hypothetical protein